VAARSAVVGLSGFLGCLRARGDDREAVFVQECSDALDEVLLAILAHLRLGILAGNHAKLCGEKEQAAHLLPGGRVGLHVTELLELRCELGGDYNGWEVVWNHDVCGSLSSCELCWVFVLWTQSSSEECRRADVCNLAGFSGAVK